MPVTGLPGSTLAQPGNFGLAGEPHIGDIIQALPGVVRHYRLDDRGGTVAGDQCGQGGVALSTYIGTRTEGRGGPSVWATSFDDETSGFKDAGAGVHLAGNEGTLRLFFKCLSYPPLISGHARGYNHGLIAGLAPSATATSDYCLWIDEGGTLNLTSTGGAGTIATASPLETGRWYEIVACWTRTPGYMSLYLSGEQVGKVATPAANYAGTVTWNLCVGGGTGLQDYDGSGKSYVGAVGIYDDVALYDQSHDALLAPAGSPAVTPGSSAAQTALWKSAIDGGDLRVTQETGEVLYTLSPHLRASSTLVETLRTGNFRGLLSTLQVEVLRSVASTGTPVFVTAATGLDVGLTTGALIGHTRSVQAATGLNLGLKAYRAMDYTLSTATGLLAGTGTYRHVSQTFDVTASSGVRLGHGTIVRLNNNVYVAVGTGLDVQPRPAETVYVTQNYYVTAGTRFEIADPDPHASRVFNLVAATAFGVAGKTKYYNTSRRVFAGTAFTVRTGLPDPTFTRTYHASAATEVRAGAAAHDPTVGLALRVRASTSLLAGAAATRTRDAVAAATTSYLVGAVAAKTGRDVFAHATTGMGVAAVDHSNQAPHVTPSLAVVLYVQAAAVVTGTTAATGFEMTHLAEAVVALPWRRGTLTLAPGGQIPH